MNVTSVEQLTKQSIKRYPHFIHNKLRNYIIIKHTHIIMVDLCMGDSGNSFRGGRIYLYH